MQGKKDAGEEMGNLLMAGGERLLEANGVSLSHRGEPAPGQILRLCRKFVEED